MSLTTNVPQQSPTVGRSWSIALRLTAFYLGSSFVILLLATVSLYQILQANLRRAQDQFLIEKVRVMRELLRDRPNEMWQLKEEVEQTWAPRQYARVFGRVLDSHGKVLAESPGMDLRLGSGEFPSPSPLGVEPREGVSLRSGAGMPVRATAALAVVGGRPDDPVTIQVALDTQLATELLLVYRRTLWLVLGLGLAGCAITGYWLARAGLRPVRQIAQTAQRIRSSNLNQRIEISRLPAELSTLAANFNAMLERLQDSFDRLSRFSADIAHELRTPVNNVRIEIEVALGKSRSMLEYQETLGSCLEECLRLSRIIDSMLFIARSEDPRTQIQREAVDIGVELERVREFYEAPAGDAGVELRVSCPLGITAPVDRMLFQRAVGNLVANAVRYTPRGGHVDLNARRENGVLQVQVADTGTGIAAADLPRIFDRFYRADRARSTGAGNAGLGLAIVKSILSLHGGTVVVNSLPGRGTVMNLQFPVDSGHH
jgi:two-component system heavy metal sensor histidine kinase CusS